MKIVGEHGRTLDEVWADGPDGLPLGRRAGLSQHVHDDRTRTRRSETSRWSRSPRTQAEYALWWIKRIGEGAVVAAAPDRGRHQAVQRRHESSDAADDVGHRLLQLVPRQATGFPSCFHGLPSGTSELLDLTRARMTSTCAPPDGDVRHVSPGVFRATRNVGIRYRRY